MTLTAHLRTLFLSVLIVAFPALVRAAPASESQLVSWLSALAPLPKVHYSWPIALELHPEELLTQYARITHALSISGRYTKASAIDRAVAIFGQVNATSPDIPASLAINYSVWHQKFRADLPPTDTGPSHDEELAFLRENFARVRDDLGAANTAHKTDIKVTAILFDAERFYITPYACDRWNRAIVKKYNAAHTIAKEIFPQAKVYWFARGAVHPSASQTGWTEVRHFTLAEQGDGAMCALYRVPEIEVTRETFRRTVARAAQYGITEVNPWVSLAAGYRRQVDQFHTYAKDWNYDLIYSWMLGREINRPWFGEPERHARFAPWNAAQIVAFYPAPFHPATPHWGQHFVAYVRGANLVKELPVIKQLSVTDE